MPKNPHIRIKQILLLQCSQRGEIVKTTFYLALDNGERSMIIRSLNNLRSSLIAKGKYTDGVDDVLVKVIGAKKKKFKIIYTED